MIPDQHPDQQGCTLQYQTLTLAGLAGPLIS